MKKILKVKNKEEEKFLRKKVKPFDFDSLSKKEIDDLIKQMRKTMNDADGIGLAANQVGLDASVFVAQWEGKFYVFFNPKIEKSSSDEVEETAEGCLSIPGNFGLTERLAKITLIAQNKSGKQVKVKAWGMLAVIFQHEVDHLNGHLFIDRLAKGAELHNS
ncbi:MAG: peptide deformylase [Candidatus Colwellbacteria bacterium CG10_big_fil_rev_8_21_14_0_10_41_28]|uniref:Peptide deformylase n=1 Tax=Candidatus Colwellbacteria bacterium CG10_big_fil_rev_8_21_14_0_10_41_28 TaxID=1974539 RepID=A0A2H0VHD1_9BACT|nr:MAG: peptide deformylase [Candidatus Colwellbacteria bacterium CG10_big_fil_rev_8_21_14_0_10_41_28]